MTLLIVLSVLVAFFYWWRAWQVWAAVPAGVLCVFLLGAAFTEVVGGVLGALGVHNQWLYNVYMPFEVMCLLYLVGYNYGVRKALVVALIGGGLFLIVQITETMHAGSYSIMSTNSYIGASLVLCLLFIALLLRQADSLEDSLVKAPFFWVYLAMVLWFGGCTPIIGLIHYLVDRDPVLAYDLYRFTQVICITRFLLLSYAGWLFARAEVMPVMARTSIRR